MNTSFYNGVSGIKTDQFYIDTISENIANISTIGYKQTHAPEFSTLFSSVLNDASTDPTSNDFGLGVRKTAPTLDMSQGILQTTDKTFDLAIGGDGWFGVQGLNNDTYYTRAGAFDIDINGNLVDPNGNYLLATSGENLTPTTLSQNIMDDFGKSYGKDGATSPTAYKVSDLSDVPLGKVGSQKKVTLPDLLYYPPVPTTEVSYQANLNPEIITNSDGQEIPNTEHFSSTIISPSGDKNILDMTFTKQVPQPSTSSTWDGQIQTLSFYENYNPGTTYDSALYKVDEATNKVYNIIDSKSGTVTFSGDGELLSTNIPTISNSGVDLTINVGEPNSYTGFSSSTSIDKSRSEQHNGLASGLLTDYGMDNQGNIIANFDNGKSSAIAKVAIYHFQNDEGLNKIDSTLFGVSANSGDPIFYTDKNGDSTLGSLIHSKRLESSNVDLSIAMNELIIAQRTYGASAKSITTSDQMLQNAINMKK
jgi:flagellar hook protein FlgE